MKIGLSCSVFGCTAVVAFNFGVVERVMMGSEPSLGDIYHNM